MSIKLRDKQNGGIDMAQFFNQAAFSYNGNTVNSNITTGEIVETLSMTKTAVVDSYSPNDTVTFVVSIVNTGTSDYNGLTMTDDLGGYTFGTQQVVPLDYTEGSVKYFIDGILQAQPTVTQTSPLTITGINVPANGNATLVYEASVNSFASPQQDGSITNTVQVNSIAKEVALSAQETINAVTSPVVSIVKTLSPTTVNYNSDVTYTFTVYNYGNAEVSAADNAFISDTFTPVLKGISVELNGAPLASSNYTYSETSGEFSTTQGIITVPASTVDQDPQTGEYSVIPGTAVLTITGTIG